MALPLVGMPMPASTLPSSLIKSLSPSLAETSKNLNFGLPFNPIGEAFFNTNAWEEYIKDILNSGTGSSSGDLSGNDIYQVIRDSIDTMGQSVMDYTDNWNNRVLQYNSDEAYKAWLRNEESAQRARDYQMQYDDTYYQRVIKSMINAGLNPVLAYSQGFSNASSVSGSSGQASASAQSMSSAKRSDTDMTSLVMYAIASILHIFDKFKV